MTIVTNVPHTSKLVFGERSREQVRAPAPPELLGFRFAAPLAVAKVSGEIDAGNVDKFRAYVASATSAGRMLIVDLSGVDFLSVAGYRALVGIQEQFAKREILWALVSSDAIDRILRLADPGRRLPTTNSMAAAGARLEQLGCRSSPQSEPADLTKS
jgi:anti-anti-sigma factor